MRNNYMSSQFCATWQRFLPPMDEPPLSTDIRQLVADSPFDTGVYGKGSDPVVLLRQQVRQRGRVGQTGEDGFDDHRVLAVEVGT